MDITKGHSFSQSASNTVQSSKNQKGNKQSFELQLDDFSLNPSYRFEHFAIGQSNRLALAACQSVLESPGHLYNPLFIHSSVGLGKTHLLQAIVCASNELEKPLNVLYLSCEKFISELIRSCEDTMLYQFRFAFRDVDILIIDDIQFLRDNEQSQAEFFHVFDYLYECGKQIVLSSDASPVGLKKFEERLISRFYQGLVARIDKPSYETRVEILMKKIEMNRWDFPVDVIEYIAKRANTNVRQMEGVLIKVSTLAKLNNTPITLAIAHDALEVRHELPRKDISLTKIINAVSESFGIKVSDLLGERRCRSIVVPRQVCMYLSRELTGLSYEEIGGQIGNRNHTTVMHACHRVEDMFKENAHVQLIVTDLIDKLTLFEQTT